jgi:hypothetical protein
MLQNETRILVKPLCTHILARTHTGGRVASTCTHTHTSTDKEYYNIYSTLNTMFTQCVHTISPSIHKHIYIVSCINITYVPFPMHYHSVINVVITSKGQSYSQKQNIDCFLTLIISADRIQVSLVE